MSIEYALLIRSSCVFIGHRDVKSWPAIHVKHDKDGEPFEWRIHWQKGTHTFCVDTDMEAKEVRDATTAAAEDAEGEAGYARVISRTSTVRRPSTPTSIFKVPLRSSYIETSEESPPYLSRTQSQIHSPTQTSASAANVLRPLSINEQHNRTNTTTTYKGSLPQRSASIMDRGRPVRKSSGACWPGVGRELGTKPAEEWKREKEVGKDARYSVADLRYR